MGDGDGGKGTEKRKKGKKKQKKNKNAREEKKNCERKEDRSTLSREDRARKRSRKQKRMEELEVTALYSLTLMGTHTRTKHCVGHNSAEPLNHRKIAAKCGNLQGIIWCRGHPRTQRANDGGISHA